MFLPSWDSAPSLISAGRSRSHAHGEQSSEEHQAPLPHRTYLPLRAPSPGGARARANDSRVRATWAHAHHIDSIHTTSLEANYELDTKLCYNSNLHLLA